MNRFAVCALIGLSLSASRVADAGETIPVGVARVDITPAYPTRLGGYAARKTEATGVGQRIWAKGMAIGSDEAKPCVLITIDNLGVSDSMVTELSRRLKIPRDSLVVAASHTHSAPVLRGVAPHIFGRKFTDVEQATIDRYTDETLGHLESLARDALRDRRPATIAWGQGSVGFAANRRTPGGPVDHALPVLRVLSPDGTIRAILVNYACHCTTIDPALNVVHGDWAGLAQQELEQRHPGAVVMTAIGCGADSNPSPRQGKDSVGNAKKHAHALADEVDRVFKSPLRPIGSAPTRRSTRVALPLEAVTRAGLDALVKAGSYPGYNASTFLARLDRGEPVPDHVDYAVTVWAFGDDLVMVFLPGEVVVDYALRLKREYDPARLWITAYANDSPCYIPSERILKEGGYEGGGAMVYYGQPSKFKPGVEDRIVTAVRSLIPDPFRDQTPTIR
jgi:hypothetical protein